jgi:hypothetical protein
MWSRLMASTSICLVLAGITTFVATASTPSITRMGEAIPIAEGTTFRVLEMGEKNATAVGDRLESGIVALDIEIDFGASSEPLAIVPYSAFALRVGDQSLPAEVMVVHVLEFPNLRPQVSRIKPDLYTLIGRNTVVGLLFRLPDGASRGNAMLELHLSAVGIIGEGGKETPASSDQEPIFVSLSPKTLR